MTLEAAYTRLFKNIKIELKDMSCQQQTISQIKEINQKKAKTKTKNPTAILKRKLNYHLGIQSLNMLSSKDFKREKQANTPDLARVAS